MRGLQYEVRVVGRVISVFGEDKEVVGRFSVGVAKGSVEGIVDLQDVEVLEEVRDGLNRNGFLLIRSPPQLAGPGGDAVREMVGVNLANPTGVAIGGSTEAEAGV